MVARHLREGLSRLWPALVLAVFCLPLFLGLGSTDLENDEAIYSYAVDSILDLGDWLSPRSSPLEHVVFLEKPPLKFWIVAAGIKSGLLPRDEFGMRFWDAVLGSIAFVYVFLIGRRLAGPICGAVAVLILFAHEPLIFNHGLRSNNMEAALLLAYCGGVYHCLRWSDGGSPRDRTRHIAAFAALFYLGFMTKFVAVIFLPMVLGGWALLVPAGRHLLRQDWRRWVLAAVVVVAAIVPWFIYQYVQWGDDVVRIMFGDHVFTRFTAYTDPAHLQPWHFYFSASTQEFSLSGALVWVVFGVVVMTVQAVRLRDPYLALILGWFFVPVVLISFGTSKLYHYFYPYLPPLALAAGYGVAWIAQRIAPMFGPRGEPTENGPSPAHRLRVVAAGFAVVAFAVALATLALGPLRLPIADGLMLRNTSVERPLIIAGILTALAAGLRASLAGAVLVGLLFVLPTPLHGYVASVRKLGVERHPLKSLGGCLRQVDATRRRAGETIDGVYAPVYEGFLHPYFYYLRQAGGWQYSKVIDDAIMQDALFDVGRQRPVVVDPGPYADFLERAVAAGYNPPPFLPIHQVVVVLPGPYAQCFNSAIWERR